MKRLREALVGACAAAVARRHAGLVRLFGFRHLSVKVGRRTIRLGAQVIVMADIGEGSVIGSGAVVTEPIPAWSVAVGHPARVIRSHRPCEQEAGQT